MLPIYPAGEKKIAGVDARVLSEEIRRHGHREVIFVPNFKAAATRLRSRLKKGDIVLTLGAGDVWKVGRQAVNAFEST